MLRAFPIRKTPCYLSMTLMKDLSAYNLLALQIMIVFMGVMEMIFWMVWPETTVFTVMAGMTH